MEEINKEEHWEKSLDHLAGRKVVTSISGGKDSAAMSLWLHEHDIEHERVFMDTGWEAPETYEYINGTLQKKIGPIKVLHAKKKMAEMIRHKALFPTRLVRWCTQELKIRPLRDYFKTIEEDFVSTVGIRRGESKARSRMVEWEFEDYFDCEVWRPIIYWTEQDVIDTHRRHGLQPNPLYLRGAERVGCWPCIFSRKSELRLLATEDPGQIDVIRDLEREVDELQVAKRIRKGMTPDEALNRTKPRFFYKEGGMMPIDEVVNWARTSYGGKQLELFAPPKEELGCMRWGLCEALEDE